MKTFALLVSVAGLVACGASATPPAEAPAAPTTTTAGAARPTCDLIDHACDPHEDEGGLPKECHDLGESAKTDEATCVARKDECLAACKAK